MARRPRVFIGSASEDLHISNALKRALDHACETDSWQAGFFAENKSTFESILEQITAYDVAVFLFSPVDRTMSRSKAAKTTRDNLIWEFGVALGALGPKRAFAIKPLEESGLKLPSDFDGIELLKLPFDQAKSNPDSGVAGVADKIRRLAQAVVNNTETIKHSFPSLKTRRGRETMQFADRRFLSFAVDGALFIKQNLRMPTHQGLRLAISSTKSVPPKYLYCTDEGTSLWLTLCSDPDYAHYSTSMRVIQNHVHDIVDLICPRHTPVELDFVSLGPGDGLKDALIICEACRRLVRDSDFQYYCPIDISNELLVTALHNVYANTSTNLRIKAVLGDITTFSEMDLVWDVRPNPNVFMILGNTLGNGDERDLIRQLGQALQDDDYLIVEVHKDSTDSFNFIESDLNRKHDFVPLKALGVKLDMTSFASVVVEEVSQVPKARTSIVKYKNVSLPGANGYQNLDEVTLSVVHHYDLDEFQKFFQKTLGLQALSKYEGELTCLFVFQKKARRK